MEELLGRGDIAWKYYKQIMPNEVVKQSVFASYKEEMYAYSSTVLGSETEKLDMICLPERNLWM